MNINIQEACATTGAHLPRLQLPILVFMNVSLKIIVDCVEGNHFRCQKDWCHLSSIESKHPQISLSLVTLFSNTPNIHTVPLQCLFLSLVLNYFQTPQTYILNLCSVFCYHAYRHTLLRALTQRRSTKFVWPRIFQLLVGSFLWLDIRFVYAFVCIWEVCAWAHAFLCTAICTLWDCNNWSWCYK